MAEKGAAQLHMICFLIIAHVGFVRSQVNLSFALKRWSEAVR
jgi:hypothetical protein